MAVNLLYNEGDVMKAMRGLVTADFLKSLGITLVVGPGAGLEVGFWQALLMNMVRNSLRAGLNAALLKQDLKEGITSGLLTALADTAAQFVCREVGKAYHPPNGEAPKLNFLTHKLAHGLIHGIAGAIANPDDPARAAFVKATGAMLAETVADIIGDTAEERLAHLVNEAAAKGEVLNRDTLMKRYQQSIQNDANIARFCVALEAFFAGKDVNMAVHAADISLENNFLQAAGAAGLAYLGGAQGAALLAGLAITTGVVFKLCYDSDGRGARYVLEGLMADGTIQVETSQGAKRYILDGHVFHDLKSLWRGLQQAVPGFRFLIDKFMGADYLAPGYDPATEACQAHEDQGPKIFSTPQADPVPNVESYPVHEDNGPRIFSTPIPEPRGPNVESYPIHEDRGPQVFARGTLPSDLPDGTWTPPKEALDKIPEALGEGKANRKGQGFRWGGEKGSDHVRIDKGDPKARFPHQEVDHVRVNSGGQMLDRNGNPLPGTATRKNPECHIPLDEWLQWKSWDKKE